MIENARIHVDIEQAMKILNKNDKRVELSRKISETNEFLAIQMVKEACDEAKYLNAALHVEMAQLLKDIFGIDL